MYQNSTIPYFHEAQHVSGKTPLIIRNLKLHWQPLVFHTLKVFGRVVGELCHAQYMPDNVHQQHRLFPVGKERPGRDAEPLPRSSAVGHERVELYLYSPYGQYGLSACTTVTFTVIFFD
jgi:hypothetical protein